MENLKKGTYFGERLSFPGKTHAGQYFDTAQGMRIVSEKEKMTSKKQPHTPNVDGCFLIK